MEIDAFDALQPRYLLQRAGDGHIQGCVRLLPPSGSATLRDTFPALLDGACAAASPTIWESSRFALNVAADAPKAAHGLATATYELFAGMIEFGLSRQLTCVHFTPLRRGNEPAQPRAPRQRRGSSLGVGEDPPHLEANAECN